MIVLEGSSLDSLGGQLTAGKALPQVLGFSIMARYAKQQTTSEQALEAPEPEFQPKTPLGRRLWELRLQIVASGEPLLDWKDLEREIAERRGDRDHHFDHLPQIPRV